MKNFFLNTGGVNIGGRRCKCIRFTDNTALLAQDERMLKNMLIELNDRCKDDEMKININKTKTNVIGRKPKNIDMQIKEKSIEQVKNFKYFGCIISSKLNCCQEVRQRIAIAKESSNRKRYIFCEPVEK